MEEERENGSCGITGFCSQGATMVFSAQEDGGGQKAAAHETMRGDYYKARVWAVLCYPCVSGGAQNYKEQPLLKSVDLFFGDWGVEIITGALCMQEGFRSFYREGWKIFIQWLSLKFWKQFLFSLILFCAVVLHYKCFKFFGLAAFNLLHWQVILASISSVIDMMQVFVRMKKAVVKQQ